MESDEAGEKYRHLLTLLRQYPDIAVAYSGGVDSTLLAYAACAALGAEHVLILHAASSLLSQKTERDAEKIMTSQFSSKVRFRKIQVNPLQDDSFVRNDRKRCYICKKLIYSRLIKEMEQEGISILVDGTNCDDLLDDRPGLKAIHELGIKTPLVESGFRKHEIRFIAALLHLENAQLPSNSCLATRLECDTIIDENLLKIVERLELFLEQCGFSGCRVRPRQKMAIIQIRESHFTRISETAVRAKILTYFRDHGYETIVLDLGGRQ